MVDDWGVCPTTHQSENAFEEEEGRSYGKGRGFIMQNNNDDGWGTETKSYGGGNNDFDDNQDWNGRNNDFGNGRGGRGGGRGGRGARGRGGGRGGFRNRQDNDGDDYGENAYGYDNDDGFKSSGFNGSRNRNNDGEDNYRRNRDFDSRDGNQYNRSSRGGRSRGDDEENGYERRDDGRERGSRGRGGGQGGGRNWGDDDENGYERRDDGRERGSRGRGGGQGGGRNFDGEDAEKPRTEIYIPPELPTDEKFLFENGVEMGINFDKYDSIEVKVSGENPPQPIECFEEAGLRNIVLENIRKSGYSKPTPVQKHALPIIMSGRDMMACAQTGSGKTAAFAVPIINTLLEKPTDLIVTSSHCEPQVVIVSPTRELTIQIWQQIMKFSLNSILKTVVSYGGTSVMHQAGKLSKGCHILVATPGRLLDFLDRGRIKFSSVRFLVLDEADRMLDMGFLPSIERIVDHETMVPAGDRQTLMFSATFPDEVQHLAGRFLNSYLFLAVGIVGGACSDVEQSFYEVTKHRKTEMLKEIIQKESDTNTLKGTMIFVEMKRKADFIAALLSEMNYPTTSIHGDRLQRQREEALADFKSGKMEILVATAVAARGLDIKNASHVINFDLPKGIDEYVHRIGRTGRVGNSGRATSFFEPEADEPLRSDLVRILKQAEQPVPDWLIAGGGNRTYAPGRRNRFGGEDVRDFDDGAGEPYSEEAYVPSMATEAEEEW